MRNVSIWMRAICLLFFVCVFPKFSPAAYNQIVLQKNSHPATQYSAELLVAKLGLNKAGLKKVDFLEAPKPGQILLAESRVAAQNITDLNEVGQIKNDGYAIVAKNGAAVIIGARPRSLLYAAGNCREWEGLSGVLVRSPDFEFRMSNCEPGKSIAEQIAELGINRVTYGDMSDTDYLTLKDSFPEIYNEFNEPFKRKCEQKAISLNRRIRDFAQQCHNADVTYYPFFYGNDIQRWSPALAKAVLKKYPQLRGKRADHSWEKATLCPSQELTWKILDACLKEYVTINAAQAEGVLVTFWDWYGINCQDERCQANKLTNFPGQLEKCVDEYYRTLNNAGKKLIVRTWSSGCPHWFDFFEEETGINGRQWVNAPGYGDFGGTQEQLWGPVINSLPPKIIIQTKAYLSDCQPNSRYSEFVGKAKPHTELIEYQITGQTIGRHYLPAAIVDFIQDTLKKAYAGIGSNGGSSILFGGLKQKDYSLLNDQINSINLYAWSRLTWDINADVNEIWRSWATNIYGPKAAPDIIHAVKLSEPATATTFSVLGFGSDTNSEFPKTIYRTEVLLQYTNRYYLPEYKKYLEPTVENIERVLQESRRCFSFIDEMMDSLEKARTNISNSQYRELNTRFSWLKQNAITRRNLAQMYWRYRYLRYLNTMRTTDPAQISEITREYTIVKDQASQLFSFNPNDKFSCYQNKLKEKPSLGSPMPLAEELYRQSISFVEDIVGPNYLKNNSK